MYTLYEFLNKFQWEDFQIVSRDGKNNLTSRKINHNDMKEAIKYYDTSEEIRLCNLSETAVIKVDFEQMEIYVED